MDSLIFLPPQAVSLLCSFQLISQPQRSWSISTALVKNEFYVKFCSTKSKEEGISLFFSLTYDDGAGAQQPDLLLQSHSVGDLLLLLPAVRPGAVRPGADAAAVLSIHVRLPGSGPILPVPVLPVLLSSPHSAFMQTEWAALAQQPAAVQGRMLNTQDSPRGVQGHREENGPSTLTFSRD